MKLTDCRKKYKWTELPVLQKKDCATVIHELTRTLAGLGFQIIETEKMVQQQAELNYAIHIMSELADKGVPVAMVYMARYHPRPQEKRTPWHPTTG
jgi:hypothetical protein